jgi:aminopeptidase 2
MPTLDMPSYLVALVVSDFNCINGTAIAGLNTSLPIRSCSRPNAINQTEFSLDVGIQIINHFEKLFDIKYPLPKLGNY